MEETGIVVEGFYYTDQQAAKQARKEAEGIAYIRENTDMKDPRVVRQLYHTVTEEKLFQTQVGISFLKEMRDFLCALPDAEELEPIAIQELTRTEEETTVLAKVRDEKRARLESERRNRKRLERVRKNLKISILVNLFFLIVAIGMIAITLSSNSPTVLSYKNKILDQYSSWEQELSQREAAVKEKEQELGIFP